MNGWVKDNSEGINRHILPTDPEDVHPIGFPHDGLLHSSLRNFLLTDAWNNW